MQPNGSSLDSVDSTVESDGVAALGRPAAFAPQSTVNVVAMPLVMLVAIQLTSQLSFITSVATAPTTAGCAARTENADVLLIAAIIAAVIALAVSRLAIEADAVRVETTSEVVPDPVAALA